MSEIPDSTADNDGLERLQRVLASRGVASRRKAEALIVEGRVRVNGRVVTELGTKLDPNKARFTVDGRAVRGQTLRYILLNKPAGFITTASDERGRETVLDLVRVPERVFPVGRLDRDTEGLLLLTNDGELANRITHPRHEIAKEYRIATPIRPTDAAMQMVRNGIVLDGKKVKPDVFRILRERRDVILLTITLHEGINRVVRRLMQAADIPVLHLQRTRIGPISLGSVDVGTWRDLTSGELSGLRQALRMPDEGATPVSRENRTPRQKDRDSGPKRTAR
ncbi:MAG: pseudouridine synthase [Chloroflexota bacterium]